MDEAQLKFRDYLSEICSISEHSWNELVPLLKTQRVGKNQLVAREDQNYTNEIFLVSGIFRLYYLGTEGKEINIAFYKGEDTLSPFFTRNINGKHICFIEALTDSVYIEFNAFKFSELMRANSDVQQFAYLIVEKELRHKIKREKQYLSQNAEKRLRSFREYYKGLENEIPHYHIASYLGISPVSLSRLRKNAK